MAESSAHRQLGRLRSLRPLRVRARWPDSALGAMAVLTVAAAALASSPAHATQTPIFALDLESTASFASALYKPPALSDDYTVQSIGAWAADGRSRQVNANLVPSQPDGFRFEPDLASAWTRFEQAPNGHGSLHAFARSSGYYFDGGASNLARSALRLHQNLLVENLGTSTTEFRLFQTTHGLLLSGGLSNAATAYAQEVTAFTGTCSDCDTPLGSASFPFGGGWLGAATVYGADATPTVSVSGEWATRYRNVEQDVSGFVDPIAGIEVQALVISDSLFLRAGGVIELDITYEGLFEVNTLGASSGYLSFGEADFGNTGTMDFLATDPLTGALSPNVRIRIVGDVDTSPPTGLATPGSAGLVLLALPWLAGLWGKVGTGRRRPGAASA